MNRQTYKTDLTDDQWTILEPLLPPPSVRGRPREHSLREILNAIFYILHAGINCAFSNSWNFKVNSVSKAALWVDWVCAKHVLIAVLNDAKSA